MCPTTEREADLQQAWNRKWRGLRSHAFLLKQLGRSPRNRAAATANPATVRFPRDQNLCRPLPCKPARTQCGSWWHNDLWQLAQRGSTASSLHKGLAARNGPRGGAGCTAGGLGSMQAREQARTLPQAIHGQPQDSKLSQGQPQKFHTVINPRSVIPQTISGVPPQDQSQRCGVELRRPTAGATGMCA